MTFSFVRSDEVSRIKSRLEHPVVDADGHQNEYLPLFLEVLAEVAGPTMVRRYVDAAKARGSGRVGPYWTLPTENTLDRATSTLPKLLHARLDELGLDYALVYPGLGLGVLAMQDDELRQASARALNTMYVETFSGLRDRLEPVAVIPNFTPEEAVAELDHAVGTLGLKSVVMASFVPRRRTLADGSEALWLDTLGHDSDFDYDPVWARCVELGVAPSFHSVGFGYGTRMSRSNYVYNHLGHFAWAQEGVCRSLTLGGVPARFPSLRRIFLEGGVTWAAQLFADLLGHYDKRNLQAIHRYDPAALDVALFTRLFEQFADQKMAAHRDAIGRAVQNSFGAPVTDPSELDDFAQGQITSPEDIRRVFADQYSFGCEADDPMNALAFDKGILPAHQQLNAVMASDIGHWDVPDMRAVLVEAYELVADGHLDAAQFEAFSYRNITRVLTEVNPQFFAGTVLDGRS